MQKAKKAFLLLLTLGLFAFSGALAGCGGDVNYPDYKNPANGGSISGAYDGKYIVSVVSMGGMRLSGVRISAKLNGEEKVSGISQNGVIEFTLPAGAYDLVVDESTLPDGYYIPADAHYATKAELSTATVAVPSRVISTTAESGTRYNVGDVMHNFSFTETSGTRYTLSELLETRKAVVLNFWFSTCIPCQSEFPAIQKAYEAYGDKLAIVALSNRDSMHTITDFKEDFGLSFYMGPDQAGITGFFNVKGFPTTVIVDRYGVVAYRSQGTEQNESVWKALFNRYTADNYTQEGNNGNTGNDPNPDIPDSWTPVDPSLSMPESAEFESTILGEGATGKVTDFRPETNENDAPFSWPWNIGSDEGGHYAFATNNKADFSYAILYSTVRLSTGDVLSYEYNTDTESGYDILYVQIDGKIAAQHSGNSGGWKRQFGIYVADHDVELQLSFSYLKDPQDPPENPETDTVRIRNITVTDIKDADETVDYRESAVNKLTLSNGKYNANLIAPGESGNDTRYYKIRYTDPNGNPSESLLFVDILSATPWAEKHAGINFQYAGQRRESSLYNVAYWLMSNVDDTDREEILFTFGDKAMRDLIIESFYVQEFSDNDLLPVTRDIQNMLVTFTRKFCQDKQLEYYEDQWLELCFYFNHIGQMHATKPGTHFDNKPCARYHNPVEGLSYTHAITLNSEGTNLTEQVVVDKILSYQGGGKWYSFTPKQSGVYYFYSTMARNDRTTDPCLSIYDPANIAYDVMLMHMDNDIRHTSFVNPQRENFYAYVRLEAGKTYAIQACMFVPGATGQYTLHIERVGNDPVQVLRVCSTGDGAWIDPTTYDAIPVARADDGYYHAVTADHDYGSVVYIDFVHPNFYDQNDHSLYEIVRAGIFDTIDKNYTQKMLEYYNRSIAGKDKNDELYGLIEADQELVDLLNALTSTIDGDSPEAYAWLMFGCYYETYGA